MATVSGIKISSGNNINIDNKMISGAQTIESLKTAISVSGIYTCYVHDITYDIDSYANVVASIINSQTKSIQVTSDDKLILMLTTDGTSWGISQYRSYSGGGDILEPQSTNLEGVTWIKAGNVVEVSGAVPSSVVSRFAITGLPKPVHSTLLFSWSRGDATTRDLWLVYSEWGIPSASIPAGFQLMINQSTSGSILPLTFQYITAS